jgi:uncharacterized protein (DUF736 family)
MANYELKPSQGSIFKNEKKTQEKQPDYNGEIKTPSGELLKISMWVKTANSGKKYFSCSIQTPMINTPPQKTQPVSENNSEPVDDLPF